MREMQMAAERLSTVIHSLAFVAAFGLLVGCGADRPGGDSADGRARADAFRVALLTPGPISDQSWNAGAYQGLMRIRDSLGAAVSHIQTRTPAEFEENFRQYGAQGYDLVFGHGFEFQDAAVRVAPEFPRTVYVTTSGNRTGPNVAGMVFGFEDASYLAGMIAAALTKTNILGVIGGQELPPVKTSFAAFEAGARASKPNIRLVTSYIGNWDDVNAGKEQALAQIARGVDVIFQNADAAGRGIFTAASEATTPEKPVYVFGSNSNQNAIAPNVVPGSVVIDLPHALLLVAREVKDGRFAGRVINLSTAENVVRLELNDALASRIPPAARRAVDSVHALLRERKLTVPTERFADSTRTPGA